MKSNKKIVGLGFAVSAMGFAGSASAAVIDTTAILSSIADAMVAIGVVGAAILSLTVGTKVFTWIARVIR